MKTSTLVLTIVGSSMLSALATSALWVLADGLRPAAPAIYVRLANPAAPAAVAAAPPAATPAPSPGAAPVLVAPGAALPDDVEPPLAMSAAAPVAPGATMAPTAPAAQPTEVVAQAPAPTASAPVAPVDTTAVAAPATEMAPTPVVSQAAPAAPVTTDEQGDAAGDDATNAVASGAEPGTEIVYRDTYISYLGYDATQITTIPWYCRRFHLAEDEVLCVCFIARAAQVPFGTAIVTYVQECGSSCQALLGYYHLSPQIFFITLAPGDDLRFPGTYQRPYRWLRDGAQAPVAFTNQEYQDLLALKLATDYLRAAPQDFFAVAQVGAPLHLLRGTSSRHAQPIALHAAAPAPQALNDNAPPEEQAPLRTEPLRTEPLRTQPSAPEHGWAHAPQGSGLIPVVPPSQAQQPQPRSGAGIASGGVPVGAMPSHLSTTATGTAMPGGAGGAPGSIIPGH